MSESQKKAQQGRVMPDEERARRSAAMKGRVFSPEHRAALSGAGKGKVKTPEHCRRISDAKKGRDFLTPKQREKLVAANRNRRMTDEQRAHLSARLTGLKRSEEAKRRMSIAKTGIRLSEETKRKIALAKTGIKYSEETLEKKRAAVTPEHRAKAAVIRAQGNRDRVWTNASRAKLGASQAARMESSKEKTSPLEASVARRLVGRSFVHQARIPGAPNRCWDFVLSGERLLIEVDGCHWHGCIACGEPGRKGVPENDLKKNRIAEKLGWELLRVKECELETHPLR